MIKRWSYSRWSTFHTCAFKYYCQYKLKLPRKPPGPAMARGLRIHKLAEDFTNGLIKKLPKELAKFKDEFKNLRKITKAKKGYAEVDASYDSKGKSSTRQDSNYFIGLIDYMAFFGNGIATGIDYKTGRWYPAHKEQAHAYGTSVMTIDATIKAVTLEFYYLDSGDIQYFDYERKDLEDMQALWVRRIDKMYNCKDYVATSNRFCNWCDFSKKNGGPCEY